MPASKHQLAASAYHIRPADLRKLLLAATNWTVRDNAYMMEASQTKNALYNRPLKRFD